MQFSSCLRRKEDLALDASMWKDVLIFWYGKMFQAYLARSLCPALESAISPRNPFFFQESSTLGIKIWMLHAYCYQNVTLPVHSESRARKNMYAYLFWCLYLLIFLFLSIYYHYHLSSIYHPSVCLYNYLSFYLSSIIHPWLHIDNSNCNYTPQGSL